MFKYIDNHIDTYSYNILPRYIYGYLSIGLLSDLTQISIHRYQYYSITHQTLYRYHTLQISMIFIHIYQGVKFPDDCVCFQCRYTYIPANAYQCLLACIDSELVFGTYGIVKCAKTFQIHTTIHTTIPTQYRPIQSQTQYNYQ